MGLTPEFSLTKRKLDSGCLILRLILDLKLIRGYFAQ